MKKITSVETMKDLFVEKGSKILAILDADGTELPVNFIPKRRQKIKWVCAGNDDHILISGLEGVIRGNRDLFLCRKCAISRARGPAYSEIYEKITKEGYTMITPEKRYEGSMKPITVRCNKGHEFPTTWNRFSSSKARCKDCFNNKRKVSSDEIRKTFQNLGYKITDAAIESYVDNKTPMECICTCGRTFSIAYTNAYRKKGGTCGKCTRRWKIIDVVDYMEDVGCEFVSVDSNEFVLNSNKVTYVCYCGTKHTAPWRSFKEGSRCNNCTKRVIRATSLEKYGVDNPSKAEQVKKKIKTTMLENHGVEYAMQKEEFVQKCIETNKKNHGGIHNFNLPEVREDANKAFIDKYGDSFGYVKELNDKARAVSKERYGHEVFIQSESGKKLMLEKYGTEYYIASDKCKDDMMEKYGSKYYVTSDHFKNAMIELYGVEHAMQNPELLSKALKTAYSTKDYTFPSGKIVQIQGYEHYALDLLISQGINEDDIVVGCENVPVIDYVYEKERKYYPDIWVKSTNTIIEVKSHYTYLRDIEKNTEKFRVTASSYNFELWVFLKSGELGMKGMFIGDMFARFYYEGSV